MVWDLCKESHMVVCDWQQELTEYLCKGEWSREDEKERTAVQKPVSTARQKVLTGIWGPVRRIAANIKWQACYLRRSSLLLQSCTPLSKLNEEKQKHSYEVRMIFSWDSCIRMGRQGSWRNRTVKKCNDSELKENKTLTRSNEETKPGEKGG